MKTASMLAFCLISAVSCVPAYRWNTPSGKPEVKVHPPNVQAKVIGRLMARNWHLKDQRENMMIFDAPMSQSQQFAAALDGTRGSCSVDVLVLPDGKTYRVILNRASFERQNGFGARFSSDAEISQQTGDLFISDLSGM